MKKCATAIVLIFFIWWMVSYYCVQKLLLELNFFIWYNNTHTILEAQ